MREYLVGFFREFGYEEVDAQVQVLSPAPKIRSRVYPYCVFFVWSSSLT
ncbi:MAG: hypothetical protein IKL66_02155 [Clostridia bacterium]|nr:hypothetical protein [Clostridia bacterium]